MKQLIDFKVVDNRPLNSSCNLLILTPERDDIELPEMKPGQFVQVATATPGVMLRRPISINNVEPESRRLWLMVRRAGKGTEWLTSLAAGASVNILLPLGNGFTIADKDMRMLLVGGGVGVAPLLYLGRRLKELGYAPEFLLGARSKDELAMLEEFSAVGDVHCSTDDGSYGAPGVVTQNPVLEGNIDMIYCCGPAPMMKAVARLAREKGIDCEVSLENMMACGLGACLCCVEKTVKGNVCVCTEGPVFNIKSLTW